MIWPPDARGLKTLPVNPDALSIYLNPNLWATVSKVDHFLQAALPTIWWQPAGECKCLVTGAQGCKFPPQPFQDVSLPSRIQATG